MLPVTLCAPVSFYSSWITSCGKLVNPCIHFTRLLCYNSCTESERLSVPNLQLLFSTSGRARLVKTLDMRRVGFAMPDCGLTLEFSCTSWFLQRDRINQATLVALNITTFLWWSVAGHRLLPFRTFSTLLLDGDPCCSQAECFTPTLPWVCCALKPLISTRHVLKWHPACVIWRWIINDKQTEISERL